MTTPEEAWQALAGQDNRNNSSASHSAWKTLTPTESTPGFFQGAWEQIKEEVLPPKKEIATPFEKGKAVVKTVATALRTGDNEWKQLTPPAPQPSKPGLVERLLTRRKRTTTAVTVYDAHAHQEDEVIDAEATDIPVEGT